MLAKLIEDLCADESHTLDYGFGDADYKRRFGDASWLEEDVLVYAPRRRGYGRMRRSALSTAVAGATRGWPRRRARPGQAGLAPAALARRR